MAGKPTVYDVAQAAGVSIATVSFAFTKPDRVKKQTLELVLREADRLGYVPRASARDLARGRTGALGFYAFDYALDPALRAEGDPAPDDGRLFPLYADEVQRGVQLECRRLGFALMVGGHQSAPHLPNVIDIAGRVDGLIAFAGAVPIAALTQVASRLPVVELGGEIRAPGASTVIVDNAAGMAQLVRHLIETHRFTRFAYLGELATPEFRQRWTAFVETLTDAGVPVPELTPVRAADEHSAERAVRVILAEGELPEVLVCDTDQTALAAVAELASAGVSVPSGVAVTGYDGILAARLHRPRVTTVQQPMEAIGRRAVQMLAAELGHQDLVVSDALLVTELSLGQTCGCD